MTAPNDDGTFIPNAWPDAPTGSAVPSVQSGPSAPFGAQVWPPSSSPTSAAPLPNPAPLPAPRPMSAAPSRSAAPAGPVAPGRAAFNLSSVLWWVLTLLVLSALLLSFQVWDRPVAEVSGMAAAFATPGYQR